MMQRKNMVWKERMSEYWMIGLLLFLIAVFSYISPVFATRGNLSNFLRSIPVLGIATLGVAMLMISGGIDLSCGAITACAGTMAAYLAVYGCHPVVCVAAGILCGGAWGLLNGFLITRFELKPFIVTVGSNYMIRGLTQMITGGVLIGGLPGWFYRISNTNLFGGMIYSNFLIFLALGAAVVLVMKYTIFGRCCYAVGASKKASGLAGIRVNSHLLKVYFIEGALAGIAGVILMSYLNVGASSEAMGLEAYAIAAVIIGGIRFEGGAGGMERAFLGLLIIEIFKNGMAVAGLNTYGQQAVTGFMILAAIVMDYFRKKKEESV